MRTVAALFVFIAVWVALSPQAASAQAQMHPPVRLMCADYNGEAPDYYRSIPRKSPVRCLISRENWVHAQQLAFVSATPSGFGQPYARARVTVTGNGGFRASGTVTAYRRRPDCDGEYWVYTRIKLRLDGEKPISHVWRPDTCSTQASPDTSVASSDPG
jgi:hypothetical protein